MMRYNMSDCLEDYDEVIHSLNMGCYVDYENDMIIFNDFKYDNVLRFNGDFGSEPMKRKFLNEIVNRIENNNNKFSKIRYVIQQYIDFNGPEKSLAQKYLDMYSEFKIFPTSTQNLDDYMRLKEWLKWKFRIISEKFDNNDMLDENQ